MTEDMLRTALDSSNAKPDEDGWLRLPEGQLFTLYAAHDGAQLTVGKIESIRLTQAVVRARSSKGETYYLALSDLFVVSVDGNSPNMLGRKAGFLG